MSDSIERARVISGFRPTSDLTMGNYFGAVQPSLELQEDPTKDLTVFVADLHGLTDQRPDQIAPYRKQIIHDCLALGLDPEKTTLYIQSDVEAPLTQIANRLSPYASVAELLRTPNLKEKMLTVKHAQDLTEEETLSANIGLLSYPVLMAADIFSQRSEWVAVGEDQEPHLELARKIAQRFNREFTRPGQSDILVSPRILAVKSLRIMSLNGKGKMSKTNPGQAIILSDDPELAGDKIKKAATAGAGEWNQVLESHFVIAYGLANEEERIELDEIKAQHMDGKQVMGAFKRVWAQVVQRKLVDFQGKRAAITDEDVESAIRKGEAKAFISAQRTLEAMREGMGF